MFVELVGLSCGPPVARSPALRSLKKPFCFQRQSQEAIARNPGKSHHSQSATCRVPPFTRRGAAAASGRHREVPNGAMTENKLCNASREQPMRHLVRHGVHTGGFWGAVCPLETEVRTHGLGVEDHSPILKHHYVLLGGVLLAHPPGGAGDREWGYSGNRTSNRQSRPWQGRRSQRHP